MGNGTVLPAWAVGLILAGASSCTFPLRFSSRTVDPEPDPGGTLTVPAGAPRILASRRNEILVRPARGAVDHPGRGGAIVWLLAPQEREWQPVALDPATGVGRLVTSQEGTYRVVVTPTAPARETPERLRLLIDRTPPKIEFQCAEVHVDPRAQHGVVRVAWTIQDALPLREPPRFHYSRDNAESWERLENIGAESGSYYWPRPPVPEEHHWLRIEAVDLAGNETARDFPIVESASQPQDALSMLEKRPAAEGSSRTRSANPASEPPSEPERGTPPRRLANRTSESAGAWEGVIAEGAILKGGTSFDGSYLREVVLRQAGGGSTPLGRAADGTITLPEWTGGPFRLEAQAAGTRIQSPRFALDSRGPRLRVLEAREGAGFVTLRWFAADDEDGQPPTVELNLRSREGGGWQTQSLAATELRDGHGTVRLEWDASVSEFFLAATDRAGNVTETPPQQIRRGSAAIPAGASEPRPLNFAGETFRGGASHYIFLDPGDAKNVASDLEVVCVPVDGGEELAVASVPRHRRSVLWELPRTSGRFWLEIRWQDLEGKARRRRGEAPFEIDASPPAVRWRTTKPTVTGQTVTLELERSRADPGNPGTGKPARGDADSGTATAEDRSPEEIAAITLYRRRMQNESWEKVPLPETAVRFEARVVAIEFASGDWPEGDWHLGVTVTDRWGNRTPSPQVGPRLRIDHTPPVVRDLAPWGDWVEGAPVQLTARFQEPPARSELRWHGRGPVIHRSLVWSRSTNFWLATVESLPTGPGRGEVAFEDAAGNRAHATFEGEVEPAVTSLTMLPASPVPPLTAVRIRYQLRPPHPLRAATAELRIVEAAGETVARVPLLRGIGHAVVSAPRAAGEYRFVVAPGPQGTPFQRTLEFRVAPSAPTVASAPVPSVGRDPSTPVFSSAGDTAAPYVRHELPELTARPTRASIEPSIADLIVEFRDFESRWRRVGQGDELEGERVALLARLRAALARAPAQAFVRRAVARLYLLRAEPQYEQARIVLSAGLPTGNGIPSGPAHPELLNDLAAVELSLGQIEAAELHLTQAIELEDTAVRRFNLGQVHLRRERFELAELAFRRAVEQDPLRSEYKQAWAHAVSRLAPDQRRETRPLLFRWASKGFVTPAEAQELERRIGPSEAGR